MKDSKHAFNVFYILMWLLLIILVASHVMDKNEDKSEINLISTHSI